MPDRLTAHVIDDEPLMLSVLSTLLAGLKLDVHCHAAAEEFFEQVEPGAGPHLVLVDKNLPGISGLELVRRHREAGHVFEAILLTGHADMQSAMDAVRLGFYSYVSKPFELEDLMADVLGAVSRLTAADGAARPTGAHTRLVPGAVRRMRFPVDPAGARLPWQELSRHGLFEALSAAADERWSGDLGVSARGEPLGNVRIAAGKIAWAQAVDQTENLGSFLWRIGRITREQLERVRKLHNKYGGAKQLATIMDEEGMIARPVLRHCLKLHIEFALTSLFSRGAVDVARTELADAGAEQPFVFEPEEVLPLPVASGFIRRWSERFKSGDRWTAITGDNDVLGPFVALPGYIASCVVAHDGSVLVAHFDNGSRKTSIFGVLLATMVDKAANLATSVELGALHEVALRCAEGLLLARWVDPEHQYLVAVLAGAGEDSRALLERLEQHSADIARWLAV